MENNSAKWYVLFTSTGYEQLVKTTIEKKVENNNLKDVVLDVKIPTEEIIEKKVVNGKEKEKIVVQKLFPCYVFIKMKYSEGANADKVATEIWYNVLKGTAGLQGFAGGHAQALKEEEVKKLGLENKVVTEDFVVGEDVKIVSGALEGFIGNIQELDKENLKAKVKVNVFNRETIVDLEFINLEKLLKN